MSRRLAVIAHVSTQSTMIWPRLFAPKRPRPQRAGSPKRKHKGMGPKPALLGFAFLCVTVAYSMFGRSEPPEPHLVSARRIIDRYEEGRPESARDYESETYAKALDHLALVSGSSSQASEARNLIMEIRGKIASQRSRVRSQSRDLAARQEARQRRDLAFFEGTRRIVSAPDPDDDRAPHFEVNQPQSTPLDSEDSGTQPPPDSESPDEPEPPEGPKGADRR